MNLRAVTARIITGWKREHADLERQAERTTDEFTREMYAAEARQLMVAINWWGKSDAR